MEHDNIESLNPIDWWIQKRHAFPNLFNLAVDYLTIPASSASIERAFSQSGLILSGRRHRLGARSLENEMMIKCNRTIIDEID